MNIWSVVTQVKHPPHAEPFITAFATRQIALKYAAEYATKNLQGFNDPIYQTIVFLYNENQYDMLIELFTECHPTISIFVVPTELRGHPLE